MAKRKTKASEAKKSAAYAGVAEMLADTDSQVRRALDQLDAFVAGDITLDALQLRAFALAFSRASDNLNAVVNDHEPEMMAVLQ